jgi:hypothetical protein
MHSYPKVYQLDHYVVSNILNGTVIIQEKVDGSQFSFGVIGSVLKIRSRSKEQDIDIPDKMFNQAIEAVKKVQHLLVPGWTYRGEYLQKPKHNTLTYARIPKNHIILFDINQSLEQYLSYEEVVRVATELGFEVVPKLFEGELKSLTLEQLTEWLKLPSILGGTTIEGVVVKNYHLFGEDKKALMAKFVSESFKEKNQTEHKVISKGDVVHAIAMRYKTDARYQKAMQHLKESGDYTESVKDIGKLIVEIRRDFIEECKQEVSEELFKHFSKDMFNIIVRGFPEWYKQQLLKGGD